MSWLVYVSKTQHFLFSIDQVRYLGTEETRFWREVIARYLYPLENDPARQRKLELELAELRNKMSLMFFLLNALFVVIIAALQWDIFLIGYNFIVVFDIELYLDL